MAITHRYHTDRAAFALELTMRDVLGGLEELASIDAYSFDPECMQILAVEPPTPETIGTVVVLKRPASDAKVLPFRAASPHGHREAG